MHPIAPISSFALCPSIKSWKIRIALFNRIVSGFKKRIYFPVAFSIPRLFALPKPIFSGLVIKVTEGNFSFKIEIELSVDALSINIISNLIPLQLSKIDVRHCKTRLIVLKLTITIETSFKTSYYLTTTFQILL